MSQFDKMVKMACKPKNAPPKPKYVDPLVAATFSDDGSLQDITRSLSLRLREPNAVVVFKALLVLHMMIRTGNTENLLTSLSSGGGDPLRLKNIANASPEQGWEGFSPPSNMGMYAMYLDVRIKCFKDLKHDFVRTQAESNRRSDGLGANSKARRLRHLAVDKGLLREVKAIQKMLDALVVCRFYEDNLQDENTVIAFRMLIKDLLVLFQAGNEGVCNILEHYFEMSKSDATESFSIYKSFIKQTDRVVDYLSMARKLHNVVNIPVPNLKHAPTGLVKALEEYLNDPDFEGNRVEYRKSLGVVEGRPGERGPSPKPAPSANTSTTQPSTSTSSAPLTSAPSASASSAAPPAQAQKIQDFFDSIQTDSQPTMFGGQPSNGFGQSPPMQQQQFPFMQQQPQFNPFRSSMMMPQQTGFIQPQMTGYPGGVGGGGFMQPQMTGQMAFGNIPQQQQSPFPQQQQAPTQFAQPQPQMQPQQTGFLQAQSTGSNPFRQSMMMGSNPTGMGQFGMGSSQPNSPFGSMSNTLPNPSFGQNPINRPGSTPAMSSNNPPKPLVAQATGSRNPFAPAGGVPPMPPKQDRGPSMNELAANRFNNMIQAMGPGQGQGQGQMGNANGAGGGGGGMADIASSFAFDSSNGQQGSGGGGSSDFMSQFGGLSVNTSTPTGTTSSSNFGTGFTNPSSVTSAPTSPGGAFLQPQKTGYGGSAIKPFKPSSSFGSQLMADLGSVPEVGSPGGAAFSLGQGTGSGGGGGGGMSQFGQLSPQLTGGGSNPFRPNGFGSLGPQSTGMGVGGGQGMQGTGMGQQATGGFGQQGAFGQGSPFAGQNRAGGGMGGGGFGQGQGQGQFGQGGGQGQGGSLI